jgi:hypothetical protein
VTRLQQALRHGKAHAAHADPADALRIACHLTLLGPAPVTRAA